MRITQEAYRGNIFSSVCLNNFSKHLKYLLLETLSHEAQNFFATAMIGSKQMLENIR